MGFFKSILIFCFWLLALPPAAAKQKVCAESSFSQTRSWPDSFWLRDLEVAVEAYLKGIISVAQKKSLSPELAEVKAGVSQIFAHRSATLAQIENQLSHTGLDCLCEFEAETRGLQDWLFILAKEIKEVEPKILGILEQQNQRARDSKHWLAKPAYMQLEIRRCFAETFSSLTRSWAPVLPDLICCQTSADHAEIMEKHDASKAANAKNFFVSELPILRQQLQLILGKDFRSANNPKSLKARLDFYSFTIRTSEAVRFLDIGSLCAMSDKDYASLYDLLEQIANTIITRNKQLKYDQKEFSLYVKKSIWIAMYWFYNIFPYKNYPWQDENFLKIEGLFRQVSALLELDEPHVFKFNSSGRHKFRTPAKERLLDTVLAKF